MSEATVVIAEVLPKANPKAPHAAKDGNGTIYKSWDIDFAPFVDKRVELTYAPKERTYNDKVYTDNFVTLLKGPIDEPAETPPLGTGEYVAAQKAPADKAAIARAVALKAAVDTYENSPLAATPKQLTDKTITLAQAYEVYLNTGKAPGTLGDEDIPF